MAPVKTEDRSDLIYSPIDFRLVYLHLTWSILYVKVMVNRDSEN